MKTISKLTAFLLALIMALSVPATSWASRVTGSIFTSNQYTHQDKTDQANIIEGIDVSYHNGTVDWKKVKAAGVKFVILRVGYRGYSKAGKVSGDTQFDTYIEAAHQAGLEIGVYFYSQALNKTEAEEEAKFVIEKIKPYQSYITLPVAYDYEFADVSAGRLDSAWANGTINKTIMTDNAIAFCDYVEKQGYKAMVYANRSFMSDQLNREILEEKYQIWLAHYVTKTNYTGSYYIWQFSSKGKIDGISGNVDSNFMYDFGFNVDNIRYYAYTGKAITPAVKVTHGNVVLKKDTDYKVEYKNNINVGVAQAVIKGIGAYEGCPAVTKNFDIIPTALENVRATSIGNNYVTVTWDKHKDASGYEVWIKNENGWKSLGNTTATAYKFTGLKPEYQYEFSIRAYKTVSGRNIGGVWGEYLKVKTNPVITSSTNGFLTINGNIYYYKNGKPVTGWVKDSNQWYYFNANGIMHTGWLTSNNKSYYLKSTGEMAVYWNKINGKWYYFTGNGDMRTGWLIAGEKRYYLGSDGVMLTGWQKIDGKQYYFGTSGLMQTGWLTLNGKRYHFDSNGVMSVYLNIIDGKKYYFSGAGVMYAGWLKISDKWYYFDSDGAMLTSSFKTINKKVYYFKENGEMAIYLNSIDSKKYYFNGAGVMYTGWLKISNKWYYFDSDDGAMVTSAFKTINKKVYYFKENGEMAVYRNSIDGKEYYFNGAGAMHTGWLKISDKWYYFNPKGDMRYGWLKSGNYWYYLGEDGAMLTGTHTIDGTTYTFSSDGKMQ